MRVVSAVVVLGAWLLVGCATGHIGQLAVPLAPNQIAKTDTILVKDFDAAKAVFKGDYSNVAEKVEAGRTRLPVLISEQLVLHLTKNGYSAKKYSAEAQGNAVVVEGVVNLVDHGSAAARFWIGMGSGMSGVHTDVKVYRAGDPSKPLAELKDVSGTSGGAGGFSGYQDWVAANAKDLALKLGDYLMGKTKK